MENTQYKGVKGSSAETNKRTLAGIGILMALLLSLGYSINPWKQPNDQVNKPPKVDSKTPGTSKSSESSSSSKTKESVPQSRNPRLRLNKVHKTESSGTKRQKANQ